jgi:acyl-CoA synthetase (AMP-forming)/AMP-acid ligase II/thioesterase domain-containing protein
MQTVGEVIQRHAFAQPDRPAIVTLGKNLLSYERLQWHVQEISVQLHRAGFGCGARIGIALLDGPEALILIVGIACHATAVPLNMHVGDVELRQLLTRARVDAVVLAETSSLAIQRAATDLDIPIIEAVVEQGPNIDCTLKTARKAAAFDTEPGPTSIALILQTSGTTGVPKLVPITHQNLLAETAKIRDWFGLTPADRCLSFLPLNYAHGLRETTFPPLITGGSIARPANHKNLEIVQWLSGLRPTWYSAFPVFHDSILAAIARVSDLTDLRCLRFILSSGTPLKPELREGLMNALGVPVLEFYGMGEAGHMSANVQHLGGWKPGTCGAPMPGEMMIANDRRALTAGQIGEVLVRGPTVTSGYLDDPQANREAFVDGWFRTGDLGSFDVDGFLSIKGRVKELINRGGEKVAPVEVEEVLMTHPAIAEVAVFGVPHPRLGEDIGAALVLHDGQNVSLPELRQFAGERLAPFKVPRAATIVRELPKDITGKIRRKELASSFRNTEISSLNRLTDADDHDCPLSADLKLIWRDLLCCDDLHIDDDFFEKGGDSLLAAQMCLAVKELTGTTVPESILLNAPTIRRLSKVIRERSEVDSKALIRISDREGHAFFFFHGDYLSGGYYVRRLAKLLRSANIYSVAPHGFSGESIPASIEQMARERLSLIRAAQPAGPFRLGGYCNGGMVAFEVARLLQADGQRIEFLALVDVPFINTGITMRLGRWVAAIMPFALSAENQEILTARVMECLWRARSFWQQTVTRRAKIVNRLQFLRNVLFHRGARSHESQGNNDSVKYKAYLRAMASHFPKPIEIPIIHYSAENSGLYLRRITSQLEIVTIPCDHLSCATTHLPVIAEHLAKRLASAESWRDNSRYLG